MEMEDVLGRSDHGGGAVREQKRDNDASDDHEKGCEEDVITKAVNEIKNHDVKQPSSNEKDLNRNKQGNQLEAARAEMQEAKEENRRLKIYLEKMMKEYETLQTQYRGMVQRDQKKSSSSDVRKEEEMEETELVLLSLGRRSSVSSDSKLTKDETRKANSKDEDDGDREGLSLGLDCKFENPNNPSRESSFGLEMKEEEEAAGETWNPNIVTERMRGGGDDIHEEVLQQNPLKKARVSVRATCDTATMNDGCQWRKYGQKIAKGNPCPRAYYRCTVGPSCPVRKQVQRCLEDTSILVTTYEGTHNHPLPMSATAMASVTSAAASMLLSGASSSSSASLTASTNLQGLNLYLSNSIKPKPFYLPNSSSSSHPTITLDLTSPPIMSSSSSSLSSLFNRFSTSTPSSFFQAPRYPSASLNFAGNVNYTLESNNTFSWGNNNGLLASDGNTNTNTTHQVPYNMVNNRTGGGALNQIGRSRAVENNVPSTSNNLLQSLMQKNVALPPPASAVFPLSLPADTVKAITADPNFQSALAAVITSIIGNSGGSSASKSVGVDQNSHLGQQYSKWRETVVPNDGSNYSAAAAKSNSYSLSIESLSPPSSSAVSHQPGSLMFSQPAQTALAYSCSKTKSASPGDTKEQSD